MSPELRIAHYRITGKLGEGGMGEVYRATDTKLKRDVAIKVLPDAFAEDADRMARFAREAQVLASLNHPNIAAIYGVEERALVMELVEGPTLAERLARGPIPLDEALPLAGQVADALEYAHEKGVVHRDLKPANIKVTPEGRVKVLDFGLARALGSEPPAGGTPPEPASSPTLTMRATLAGIILGTAAYMSPEQARGTAADKRADIWSFGVVLYEMLAGRQMFSGATVSDTLAAVLRADPDWSCLPAATPPAIRRLLRRCLERDRKRRLADIADARLEIEEALAGPPENPPAAVPAARFPRLPWAAAGLLAMAVAVLAFFHFRSAPPEEREVHFQVNPPPGAEFVLGAGGGSAISPDGRLIALVATAGGIPKLWVRALDSVAARELPGTDGAQYPFWSPDNRSLGFFAAGKLKRVDLAGGTAVVLADAPAGRGGAWNREGTVLFASGTTGGLRRISATGGAAAPFTTLEPSGHDGSHRWPQFLPDGRFVYYVLSGERRLTGVYLGSLDRPRERTQIVEGSAFANYVPPRVGHPGYLLWLRQGRLTAQPFDPGSARFSGEAQLVTGAEALFFSNLYPGFSASNSGSILFSSGSERYQLTWFSREGKVLGAPGRPDRYAGVRISPDGTRAALSVVGDSGDRDIWTLDFGREVQTRLSSGGRGLVPIWSPDGRKIVYYTISGNSIFERSASAAGREEIVVESPHIVYADDVSPDGRYLMYEELDPDGHICLWLLPLESSGPGGRKPVPYLKAANTLSNAQFSPNGKWIAYISDESGHPEVYVQSLPASSETRWQVSSAGGNYPRWRRDGKEVFYRAPDGRLMVVSARPSGRGLEFGTPSALFRVTEPVGPHAYPYDIAPDGQRILALVPANAAGAASLTVLINWQAGLKP